MAVNRNGHEKRSGKGGKERVTKQGRDEGRGWRRWARSVSTCVQKKQLSGGVTCGVQFVLFTVRNLNTE